MWQGAYGRIRGALGVLDKAVEANGAMAVGGLLSSNMARSASVAGQNIFRAAADNHSLYWKYGAAMGAGALLGAQGERDGRLGRIGVGMAHGAMYMRGLQRGGWNRDMKAWTAGIVGGAVGGGLVGMNMGTGALAGAGVVGLGRGYSRYREGLTPFTAADLNSRQARRAYTTGAVPAFQREGASWMSGQLEGINNSGATRRMKRRMRTAEAGARRGATMPGPY